MMNWYTAIVLKDHDGSFIAHIPDLRGIEARAATVKEVLESISNMANDHARDWIEAGRGVGRWLPMPRDMTEIPVEEDTQEALRALVPVTSPGETIKISISIDKGLLQSADRAAAQEGLSRSAYIAAAIGARMRGIFDRPIPASKAERMMLVPVGSNYQHGGLVVDRVTNRAETAYVKTPPRKKLKK